MYIEVKKTKKVYIKWLYVFSDVRYWEDSFYNKVQDDENGTNAPMKNGDTWELVIDIDTGRIKDWPQGTTAEIHYKVCDAGEYIVKDNDHKEVLKLQGYVPSCLSPEENGFGDYIIMRIEPDGDIINWKPSLVKAMFVE